MRLSMGRDCSGATVARYELQGPWIKSRLRLDFAHWSTLGLGPIQPSGKWEPSLFPTANYSGRGVDHLQLVASGLKKE